AATTLWHNRAATPGVRVRLDAGPDNPWGVGAQLRIGNGPVREIRFGSAYWSTDDPVTVLTRRTGDTELVVRWPGGREQRVPLPASATSRELRVSRTGS